MDFTIPQGRLVITLVRTVAGLDPAAYAAHSLRSGFLTTGGRDGIPLDLLMQLSGHKSHHIAVRYFQAGAVHQNRPPTCCRSRGT